MSKSKQRKTRKKRKRKRVFGREFAYKEVGEVVHTREKGYVTKNTTWVKVTEKGRVNWLIIDNKTRKVRSRVPYKTGESLMRAWYVQRQASSLAKQGNISYREAMQLIKASKEQKYGRWVIGWEYIRRHVPNAHS